MGTATAASMTGAPGLDPAKEDLPACIAPISILLSKTRCIQRSFVVRLGPGDLDPDTVRRIIQSVPPQQLKGLSPYLEVDNWWTWPDCGPHNCPVPPWWMNPQCMVVGYTLRRVSPGGCSQPFVGYTFGRVPIRLPASAPTTLQRREKC